MATKERTRTFRNLRPQFFTDTTGGNPEELKHRRHETYSRELNKKDRIVYEMRKGSEFDMPEEEEIVAFLQYLGHYEDK